MFIGHFALAYAAKRVVPRTSLGTLFAAAQLPDLVWPWLTLVGVEHATISPGDTVFTPLRFDSYPVSHSLLAVAAWGAAFGAIHYWRRRRGLDAAALALLVVSHWLLDFVTHRPDLPLWPGGPRLGLGLWNWVSATIAVELVLFAAGLWLAVSATRPRDAIGRWGFAGLALLLLLIYAATVTSPPPPSMTAVGWAGAIGGILFFALGTWVDRHREPRAA
jgi:LexA-binding, inner membrane-associated putative hydrolase